MHPCRHESSSRIVGDSLAPGAFASALSTPQSVPSGPQSIQARPFQPVSSWNGYLQTLTGEILFLAAPPLKGHQNETERRAPYEILVAKDVCDNPDPPTYVRTLGIKGAEIRTEPLKALSEISVAAG